MKSFAKILLIGAVAVAAIAISAAPSEAAKKKKARTAAMSDSCNDAALCSANCGPAGCQVNFCGFDKKWHLSLLTPVCVIGNCPPKC
jgi:hypothetical protein